MDSEATMYNMTVGGYSGNAGDAMASVNTMKFTTVDADNDEAGVNCAINRGGGFWYKACGYVQVTGSRGGIMIGHGWKLLPEISKSLQTSRGWLLCP